METSNSPNQDLFDTRHSDEQISEFSKSSDSISAIPFAAEVRPHNLQTFFGQEHLVGEQMPLRLAIDSGEIHSMILWGPPGIGKTTLARIAANEAKASLIELSAVMAGITDIRQAIESGKNNIKVGKKTLVFVDEVHRFNKNQQDSFLPHIENGTIIFIGATTENPSFEINNALLSRCSVYKLEALSTETLIRLFKEALNLANRSSMYFSDEQLEKVAINSDGDARKGLNVLELILEALENESKDKQELSDKLFAQIFQASVRRFDKKGDYFYDFISALHKSVRGSAPDAALYWFCRLIDGGCDPIYIARRVVRMASEDIGNADPQALSIALNSWQVQERLGSPEGELAIAQAIVYLSCAPKSNAVYKAFNNARSTVQNSNSLEVPIHLRNPTTNLMAELNHGLEYRYSHDEEGSYSAGESYFPEILKDSLFYEPTDNGIESDIKEKLKELRLRDLRSLQKRYP